MTHGQSNYQVRFDWGLEGARAIGEGADVIVLVDVLAATSEAEQAPDASTHTLLEGLLTGPGTTVVAAGLTNRTAVAKWLLDRQGDKGERFMIAIVAAGERWGNGDIRLAVEDQLAAGALIDALADLGIDYCSPEAAAASAAFTGLRNATGHLVGASSSGRALAAEGRRGEIDLAIDLDSSDDVEILGEMSLGEFDATA